MDDLGEGRGGREGRGGEGRGGEGRGEREGRGRDCCRTLDLVFFVKQNILRLGSMGCCFDPKNIWGRGSPGPARRSLAEMSDLP